MNKGQGNIKLPCPFCAPRARRRTRGSARQCHMKRSYGNCLTLPRTPAFSIQTLRSDLKPKSRNADTKVGLARELGCQRSTGMIYMNIFGGMCFWARWVSLWTAHDEPRKMRAKPEITPQTEFGGSDERVVQTHDNQQTGMAAGGVGPLQPSEHLSKHVVRQREVSIA